MKRTFIIVLLLLGFVLAGFDINIDRALLKDYLNGVLYRISGRYDAMKHMWFSFYRNFRGLSKVLIANSFHEPGTP